MHPSAPLATGLSRGFGRFVVPSASHFLLPSSCSPYSSHPTALMVFEVREVGQIDELLELAATCCPQLAILMFPMGISASLAKLAQFEK